MAKDKVTSETETKQGKTTELNACLFELESLQRLLENYLDNDNGITNPEKEVLLLLVRVACKKLSYFQDKYDFQVDERDQFFVADLLEFARKLQAET